MLWETQIQKKTKKKQKKKTNIIIMSKNFFKIFD